jgi:glycosyltransferase involved in cell wall biosynthesis
VGGFVRDSGQLLSLDNIDYLPWQDRAGLAAVYCSSTVILMPSRWESFGLVAAEAMSYGKPVVASDCCSLPEIVHDGENGWLFPSGDVDEFLDVLRGLDLEECRTLSARCYETYVKFYSSIRMTEYCQRLYAELIDIEGRPDPVNYSMQANQDTPRSMSTDEAHFGTTF